MRQPNRLDYAPLPRSMSRKRMALIVGTAATTGIVIGGVTYVIAQPTTRPVVMGDMVAPTPVVKPATTHSVPLPGTPAPTTAPWSEQTDK